MNETVDDLKFDLDSSIFTSTLILGMGLITWVARIGFPTVQYDFFTICGSSLLICNFSVLYKLLFKTENLLGKDAVITSTLFLFFLSLSFFDNNILTPIVFILSFSGYASFFFLLIRIDKKSIFAKLLIWLVFPSLLLVWILGHMYQIAIHHPLFVEKIGMGIISVDQLFHASITEMIRTYGVPSYGFYGTPYLPYHFGSHILFSRFSDLFAISALEAYNYVYPIVFLPLYFRAFLFLTKDLARTFKNGTFRITSDWIFWLLFIVINIGCMPNSFLKKLGVSDSWIVSESYLVSITFLFLSISVGLAVLNCDGKKRNIILHSLLFCVLVMIMGFSKISVAVVFIGAAWYLILRSGKWRSPLVLVNGILLLVILAVILKMTTPLSTDRISTNFYPLHSIKTFTDSEFRELFVFIYYFFLIVYILVRLSSQNVKSFSDLHLAIKSKKILDIEFLLAISLIGFVPPAILFIGQGSGFYFMDVQARLSLVFLAAWILANIGITRSLRFLWKYSLVFVLAVLIFLNNVFSRFEDLINANLSLRILMIGEHPSQSKYHSGNKNVYDYLAGDPGLIKEKIKEIAYLPSKILYETSPARGKFAFYRWVADTCRNIPNKSHYYVSIPRAEAFWNDANIVPDAIPFILPALTGMASSNGLPTNFNKLKLEDYYGYSAYRNFGIDSVNCKEVPDKKVINFLPNQITIYPCP